MDIRYVKLKVVNAFKSFFGLNVKKKIAVGGKADTNTRVDKEDRELPYFDCDGTWVTITYKDKTKPNGLGSMSMQSKLLFNLWQKEMTTNWGVAIPV